MCHFRFTRCHLYFISAVSPVLTSHRSILWQHLASCLRGSSPLSPQHLCWHSFGSPLAYHPINYLGVLRSYYTLAIIFDQLETGIVEKFFLLFLSQSTILKHSLYDFSGYDPIGLGSGGQLNSLSMYWLSFLPNYVLFVPLSTSWDYIP